MLSPVAENRLLVAVRLMNNYGNTYNTSKGLKETR